MFWSRPGIGGGWNGPRSMSAAVKTCVPGRARAADCVDLDDPCVCVRRADEGGMKRAGELHVLDVQAPAFEKARVLAPKNSLTHDSAHAPTVFHSRWPGVAVGALRPEGFRAAPAYMQPADLSR